MNRSAEKAARKRPVNLTLSEDLVAEVKTVTNNLSGIVESLLVEFVSVVLHSLEMVSVGNENLGERVGSLAEDGDLIVAALDDLVIRAFG